MKLRDYQEQISTRAAALLERYGLAYLAMECRTGKTATALATAEKFGVFSVLFLTKKKAVPSVQRDYDNWGHKPFALTVTNYESAHKVAGVFDLVVLDEAHGLGAFPKPSKRQQLARSLADGKPCLFLSGTPTPESYAQMFHQMQISQANPWRAFPTFYKWARGGYVDVQQRMVNGRPLNDYTRANQARIMADIAPYLITYTQAAAGFAAEVVERDLSVAMRPETAALFKALRRDRVATWQGHTILADTPAALLNKLHQVSGGTVIAEDGTRLLLDDSKAQEIARRWPGGHVAIFYTYQAEGDLLRQVFGDRCTDTPETFQADPRTVFVGQVKAAREGTRLDTATALVFYSLDYSFLSYEQAKQRASSFERNQAAEAVYLVADCGLDGDILKAVRSKQDFTLAYYGKQLRKRGE